MQRRLVLMRHGHAEEKRDDYARRLTDAGCAAVRRAGEQLASSSFNPQRILTSPAPRAHETAQLLARVLAHSGSLQVEPALYLAEQAPYLEALRSLPSEVSRVLVVGHNPTLSGLARSLGEPGPELRPAEYADLRLELDAWGDL